MAQELIDRVEVLEANDRATRETLKDLAEGQRQLDFKIDEINADVKDLKQGMSDIKTTLNRINHRIDQMDQRLDRIDGHLGI